jgi:hypothetical protein
VHHRVARFSVRFGAETLQKADDFRTMRWLVEVTSIGKTDKQPYCVEADSWQRALQSARALRGDTGPMSGFSIELLDVGYRAVDPMARLVYVVNRAADDAPITQPDAAIATRPSVAAPAPPRASSRPVAPSMPPRSAPPARPPSVAPPAQQHPSVPPRAISAPAPSNEAARGARSGSNRPQTLGFASEGVAILQDAVRAAQQAPQPVTPPQVAAPPPQPPAVAAAPPPAPSVPAPPIPEGLPPTQVIFKREQDPTKASPITYREYVFAVAAATSESDAERLIYAQFDLVRHAISSARPGKLVNLAVFDVVFAGRPPVKPLVTLAWKDWKRGPETHFPRRESHVPPHPAVQSNAPLSNRPPPVAVEAPMPFLTAPAPAPVAAMAADSRISARALPMDAPVVQSLDNAQTTPPNDPPAFPAPSERLRAAPPVSGAHVTAAWQPSEPLPNPPVPQGLDIPPLSAPIENNYPPSAPPVSAQNGPMSLVPTPSVRVRGDELITSLFESMHDLHFLRDAVEGGAFCLGLALEKVPSRIGIVHLYDIDHREFVIACAQGVGAEALLLFRSREEDALLAKAMRKTRAVVLNDATTAEAARADRFQSIGSVRSIIVAPVVLAGRFLGAIELLDPLDGEPFTDTDGYALTYIAEQYAEFVATRGVVIDPDRIRKPFDSASRLR